MIFYCFSAWLSHAWFGWKHVTFFKVQLYSPTFRRRKSCTLKSVNKSRSRPKRRSESVASAPHIILSSVKPFQASEVFIFARRCSALLDNGFCTKSNYFGASIIFYIISQSTGHTFLPGSLSQDDFYAC